MSADVVSLVGHGGGDICVCAHADEEDAEVADAHVLDPADEREADDGEAGVEGDDGTAEVVLVAEPAGEVHHYACGGVGGRDEALGFGEGEAHAAAEDDGEEVGEGVGDCEEELVMVLRGEKEM